MTMQDLPKTKRKQITATWKNGSDIEKWERDSKALGYSDPSKCIRDLAEEARILKIARLEGALPSSAAAD